MDQGSEFLFVGIDAHQEKLLVAVLAADAKVPEPVVELANRLSTVRR